jgi:hypothetical protein
MSIIVDIPEFWEVRTMDINTRQHVTIYVALQQLHKVATKVATFSATLVQLYQRFTPIGVKYGTNWSCTRLNLAVTGQLSSESESAVPIGAVLSGNPATIVSAFTI